MLRLLVTFISLLTLVSNFFVFKSYQYQGKFAHETLNNLYTFSNNQLNIINFKYPSLAFNSVPILTYLSRYDLKNKNYFEAIEKLKTSLIYNPNSIYSKYLLARAYIFINDFDQSSDILESLFDEYPNLETASALYFALLGEQSKLEKLKTHYNKLLKISNKKIWSFYEQAIKNSIKSKSDSIFYMKVLSQYELQIK